jgi:hypothetical protein
MLFIMHSPFMVWYYRQRWRIRNLPTDWIVWRLRLRLWWRRLRRGNEGQRGESRD